MREYTIDGTTYYAVGDRLYYVPDNPEAHGHEQVDDHGVHLFWHDDWGEPTPCRIEWGGHIHSSVKATPLSDHIKRYVSVGEFTTAIPMESVTPDDINECPDCGGWAGSVDEPPRCFDCGYGLGDGEDDDEST